MLSWAIADVELRIRRRIVGGLPVVREDATPEERQEVYAAMLREVEGGAQIAARLSTDPEMPTTIEEKTLTGFRRHDGQPYIEARQVKAALKLVAQRLGFYQARRGSKQVLQHDLFVEGSDGSDRIPLEDGGEVAQLSRPISVLTRQGPRTLIKCAEYVTEPRLRFRIRLLRGGIGSKLISEAQIRDMLELAAENGLGADRSQGEGTFDVIAVEWSEPD